MVKSIWNIAVGCVLLAASPAVLFGQVRLASGLGEANVGGQRVIVHATVTVPPGLDGNIVAQAALRDQGARPFEPAELVMTGLVWDQFFNGGPDWVIQYYNPSGAPLSALTSLTNAQSTWGGVGTSVFNYQYGGTTGRCPSLVKECQGPQTFDGFNDLGWASMGGCCTLAVTWFSTSIDEIDMALNTRFNWTTGGGSGFDVETVIAHEAGHGLGLGHTSVNGAVMEATYGGTRRDLHIDDQRGVTYLYPATNSTDSISGNVMGSSGPITDATVSVADFPVSTTTDSFGNYSLAGVPDIGSYSVTASAQGYQSQAYQSPVNAGTAGVNFVLASTGGSGDEDTGGGGCIPKGRFGNNCK